MRVLVTGGLGFTGRPVVAQLLARGYEVTTVTSRARRDGVTGASTVVADLRDRHAVAAAIQEVQPEAVCHLAALTRVRDSFTDPVGYFDVNVTGTVNLLAALELARPTLSVPRLVFASTGAVYGVRDGELDEDLAPQPANPYGASKLAAEQLIGYQAATGRLAAASLRCFNIAGAVDRPDPDTTRIIPKTLAVAAGDFDRVQVNGDGTALREYTHVNDVARAYVLALDAARPGRHAVYNVGSGQGVTVAQVIDAARRITGRPIAVEHLPPKPEPRVMIADSARIRRELGWTPQSSSLDQLLTDSWRALHAAAGRT